jgi:transcriptional regulator
VYIPKINEETDIAVLHALMRSHPLGTWITEVDGQLAANHVPFLIDPSRGEFGTLICHVARANEVWRSHSKAVDSLIVFQGPQTYITPSWYPSKQQHGKVVPTWNYAVVHAHGMPRAIDDRDWLLRHVSGLTRDNEAKFSEAKQTQPWQVSDAPEDYIDGMLKAIVGIEIPITRLTGKWKTSQNRPEADKRGVIEGLQQSGDASSLEMAALVEKTLRKPGSN